MWYEFVDLGPWHSYNFVTFLVHDEVYIVCEHMYSYFHISSTRFRDRDVNGEIRDKIPQGYEDKGTSVWSNLKVDAREQLACLLLQFSLSILIILP